jgi:formate hydrogenlyase subunit 3/multisubunit Na+/H+ antiporter MnhD subunit
MVGLAQTNPKTVLAYSSISQMGLMTVLVGAALMAPDAAPLALTAVVVFAVHHGLAKGALFLSVGVGGGPHWLLRLGQAVAALALAGAPWTSGAAAKYLLKGALGAAPAPWPMWVDAMLPLSSFATALLLLRFMLLVARSKGRAHLGRWLPWGLSVLSVVVAVLWWMPDTALAGAKLEGLIPIAAAVAVALLAGAAPALLRAWRIPPGDVLALVAFAGARAWRVMASTRDAVAGLAARAPPAGAVWRLRGRSRGRAPALRTDAVAGTAFVFLVVLFFLLLLP